MIRKAVIGCMITALLTAAILFALDVPYAQQAAARLAAFAGAADTDGAQADGSGAKKTAGRLSIGTDENQLVSLTQEDTAQAADTAGENAVPGAGRQSGYADGNQKPDGQSGEGAQSGQAGSLNQQNGQTGSAGEQNGQAGGAGRQDEQTGSAGEQNGQADSAGQHGGQADSAGQQAAGNDASNTFQTVTQEYFSDALFIGDSRTVGMQQSGLLPNAAYYAKIGIGIGDILTQRIVSEGGSMISVKEALSRHSFGKVYVMIGINDMSRGSVDWFTEQYQEILHTIRQTQPDAVVYIQGNIPMSYRTQDFTGALNNKNLEQRNEASRQLADGKNIFYLDVNAVYADVNGHLDTTYTTDGLHVSTKYYPRWVDYLMQHAIVR